MRQFLLPLILQALIFLFSRPAFSFEVVLYQHVIPAPSPGSDPLCTSGAFGAPFVLGPDQGCQTDFTAPPYGALVKSTGAVDDNFYTVFFSSPDCDPTKVITHSGEGCVDVTAGFQSFQVWNMCTSDNEQCLGGS